jgi:hypothetical protein
VGLTRRRKISFPKANEARMALPTQIDEWSDGRDFSTKVGMNGLCAYPVGAVER